MEQLLTKLKTIEPNKEYQQRSRMLILNSPQLGYPGLLGQLIETLQYSAAYSLAIIFIFLLVGGLTLINYEILTPAALSNMDPQELQEEADNFAINIQLSQAEYYENSAKTIEVALNATSDEFEKGDREEINDLLEKLAL